MYTVNMGAIGLMEVEVLHVIQVSIVVVVATRVVEIVGERAVISSGAWKVSTGTITAEDVNRDVVLR